MPRATRSSRTPLPTIGEAVDNTDLPWNAGADPPWFVQTEVTLEGAWAGRVGYPASFTGQPWLETRVSGPGYLTFGRLPAVSGALDRVAYVPGPAVLVTSPAGGETLHRREFTTIRWIATEDVGEARIELGRGGVRQPRG